MRVVMHLLSSWQASAQVPNLQVKEVLLTAAAIRRDGAGSIRLQSSEANTSDIEGYGMDRGEWHTTYLQYVGMFQDRCGLTLTYP